MHRVGRPLLVLVTLAACGPSPAPSSSAKRQDRVAELAGGSGHMCARYESGRLKCWGSNEWGELGTGDKNPRAEPTEVRALDDATRIVASVGYTCALRRDRTVACWGRSFAGMCRRHSDRKAADELRPGDVVSLTTERDAKNRPFVRVEAGRPLNEQAGHKGPVSLDRVDERSLASHGFGAEVKRALEARRELSRAAGVHLSRLAPRDDGPDRGFSRGRGR